MRRPIAIDLSADGAPRDPLARLEGELARSLVGEGLLAPAELDEARARQRALGGRLATCLLELGLADEVRLRGLCGRLLRVPTALPADVAAAPPTILACVDPELALRFRVIPYARSGSALLLATAEPWRLPLLDSLAARAGGPISPRFLDEAPLARLLGRLYAAPVDPRHLAEPPPRRRALALRPRAAAAEAPPAELLSETGFEALYQRGAGAGPAPPSGPPEPTRDGVEPPEPAPARPGGRPAPLRARLDPAQLAPLADLDAARAALAGAGDVEQVGWLLARVALAARGGAHRGSGLDAGALLAFAAEAGATLERLAREARQAAPAASRRTPGSGLGR